MPGAAPVAAPLSLSSGCFVGSSSSLPSAVPAEPAMPLWPPAGSLPWEAPPWACEACPATEGSAPGPVVLETWTRAGTAVPMKRAAAAMPTAA